MNFAVYNADGVILRYGSCPPDHARLQPDRDQFVFEGEASDALHYIDIATGERRDKFQFSAALSGLALSGLPIPCTLRFEDQVVAVADGVANLSFTLPGTHTVRVEALHYIPRDYEVTA